MFGVRSPVIAPPKLVVAVVKLPTPTPPNPSTDARVSCADAAALTSRAATMIAAHELVRIVFPHTLAMPIGARVVPECSGVDGRRKSPIGSRMSPFDDSSGQALRRQ